MSESFDVEATKKELEEQLQRDLHRLAEERKEGLHRIDWQLAEAVENLHAETVQKANDRIQMHKKVLADLDKGVVPSMHSRPGQASPRSGDDSVGSSSESEEEEQPGVWSNMVGFFNRHVPSNGAMSSFTAPSSSMFTGGGGSLSSLSISSLSDLAGKTGLAAFGASPTAERAGASRAFEPGPSQPQPLQVMQAVEANGGGSSRSSSHTAPPPVLAALPGSDQALLDKMKQDWTGSGTPPATPSSPSARQTSTSFRRPNKTPLAAPPPPPPAPSPFDDEDDMPSFPSRPPDFHAPQHFQRGVSRQGSWAPWPSRRL
eukprot:TRINITY_DN157_c0_g1_i1.p1 TRINITY_DN157_c0_g1~~TRINITY_DN157_c0_g1_i1.p1  ORF type:complete len:356 (-),score=74.13 TRINITY_DN157_c0_g1_i1:66-1013(-)